MFQLSRVEEADLYTETERGLVPLQGVSISAEVIDVASKVTVVQRFRNDEKKPIEATSCFPLEEVHSGPTFSFMVLDPQVNIDSIALSS